MAGVRLHHPTLRGATVVFEIPGQPYPAGGFDCSACERRHIDKAVHLRLDAAGDVVVAEETLEQIRPFAAALFEIKERVAKPAPLVIGMMNGGPREVARIVRKEF